MTDTTVKPKGALTTLMNVGWWICIAIISALIVRAGTTYGYIVLEPKKIEVEQPTCLNLNTKNGIMWVAHEGEPYMLISMIDVKELPVKEEAKK